MSGNKIVHTQKYTQINQRKPDFLFLKRTLLSQNLFFDQRLIFAFCARPVHLVDSFLMTFAVEIFLAHKLARIPRNVDIHHDFIGINYRSLAIPILVHLGFF
jgi:hypothetical protein